MSQPSIALPRIASWSIVIIAVLLSITALKLAASLVAPVALGLVVAIVLSPVLSPLHRMGLPRAISATMALIGTAGGMLLLLALLGPVLIAAAEAWPRVEQEIRIWINRLTYAVRGLDSLGDELEKTLTEGGDQAMPTLIDALWAAPNFMGQLLIFGGTLFFFLMTRDDIYAAIGSRQSSLRRADRAVSHYFMTITAINAGLGLATFAAMTAIGMPNAMIWGFAAFLLNFILYLGPIGLIVALAIAGMTQFTGAYAFLPPLVYFAFNLTEAQFVTPSLVGQRLNINPLGVFLSILFGLWLWGPVGAIVALPMLVWFGALLSVQPSGVRSRNDVTQKAA